MTRMISNCSIDYFYLVVLQPGIGPLLPIDKIQSLKYNISHIAYQVSMF
jgi:hypothetical protein